MIICLKIKEIQDFKSKDSFSENPAFPVACLTVRFIVLFKFTLQHNIPEWIPSVWWLSSCNLLPRTVVRTAATALRFCCGEFVVRKPLSLTSLMKWCQYALYSTTRVMCQPPNICTWLNIKLLSNIPCGALNNIILQKMWITGKCIDYIGCWINSANPYLTAGSKALGGKIIIIRPVRVFLGFYRVVRWITILTKACCL